jgi:hypothetical protein
MRVTAGRIFSPGTGGSGWFYPRPCYLQNIILVKTLLCESGRLFPLQAPVDHPQPCYPHKQNIFKIHRYVQKQGAGCGLLFQLHLPRPLRPAFTKTYKYSIMEDMDDSSPLSRNRCPFNSKPQKTRNSRFFSKSCRICESRQVVNF